MAYLVAYGCPQCRCLTRNLPSPEPAISRRRYPPPPLTVPTLLPPKTPYPSHTRHPNFPQISYDSAQLLTRAHTKARSFFRPNSAQSSVMRLWLQKPRHASFVFLGPMLVAFPAERRHSFIWYVYAAVGPSVSIVSVPSGSSGCCGSGSCEGPSMVGLELGESLAGAGVEEVSEDLAVSGARDASCSSRSCCCKRWNSKISFGGASFHRPLRAWRMTPIGMVVVATNSLPTCSRFMCGTTSSGSVVVHSEMQVPSR